jgi:Acetyltransferases
MKIRKYNESDWDEICSIYDRAKPDEMRNSCDPDAIIPLEEDLTALISFNYSEIFVAELDGKIVGFSGYSGNLISWLMVDPDYYGQGIGTTLFETVLAQTGDDSYLYVAKYNEPAKALYTKKGFKFVDEFTGNYNDYNVEILLLALKPEIQIRK